MLGPLVFILYIDDLHHSVTSSTFKLFADDITVYKVVTIASVSDCHLLQEDLLDCCLAGAIESWKM